MAVSMKIQSAKDYKRSLSVLKRPVLWLSLVAAHTYWRSNDSLASIIWLFLRLAASSGVFLLLHVNCLYAYMQMTNCHKLWPCGMLWPLPGTHTDRSAFFTLLRRWLAEAFHLPNCCTSPRLCVQMGSSQLHHRWSFLPWTWTLTTSLRQNATSVRSRTSCYF